MSKLSIADRSSMVSYLMLPRKDAKPTINLKINNTTRRAESSIMT